MKFRTPTHEAPLKVLALGAGVQSSFLFLASCAGELPKLDVAIFADTGYEPVGVYDHLSWLIDMGKQAGIPVIKCGVGTLRQDSIDRMTTGPGGTGSRQSAAPFYIRNPDGSRGQIRRQCTGSYKIEPMERVIRETLLGLQRGQRSQPVPLIEQWIGISFDEVNRCSYPGMYRSKKTNVGSDLFGGAVTQASPVWSPLRWKFHCYPLCGRVYNADRTVSRCAYLGTYSNGRERVYTRSMCEEWLRRKFSDREIPRSACIGCPYRSNVEWRRMRDSDPKSWRDALEFDAAIRANRGSLLGTPFVHDSLVPLAMVNLDADELLRHVEANAVVCSDAASAYANILDRYIHHVVDHSVRYVAGRVHINGLRHHESQGRE